MLGHQAIKTAFRLLGKRIVGRTLIGKFGMSANWRDRPRIKQRCPCRQPSTTCAASFCTGSVLVIDGGLTAA